MPCMLPVDRIHDALLSVGELPVRPVQVLHRLRHVHHRCQLRRLVVAVGAALPQRPHPPHRLAVRTGRHVLKVAQPALVYELLYAPRLQQRIKQIRERRIVQPARRGRLSEEPGLRPLVPQYPVGPGKRMVGLVYDDKGKVNSEQFASALRSISVPSPFERGEKLFSPCQCLYACHLHLFRLVNLPAADNQSMLYAEAVQCPRYLLDQLPPMRHDKNSCGSKFFTIHSSLFPPDGSGHQVCLSRACRHLHHHAPLPFPSLIQPVQHLLLIVSQHSDMQNLNRDGKGQLPSLSIREGGDYRLRLFLPHWGTKR